MASSALLVCQDISTVVSTGIDSHSNLSLLDSVVIDGIIRLRKIGVTRFIFVGLGETSSKSKRIVDFYHQELSDCDCIYYDAKGNNFDYGDIVINMRCILLNDATIISSWRTIPSVGELKQLINCNNHLASILISPHHSLSLDQYIAYNGDTHHLAEVEGVSNQNKNLYAASMGVYFLQKDTLSLLSEFTLSTHPTSILSILHYLNRLHPQSVITVEADIVSTQCSVLFTVDCPEYLSLSRSDRTQLALFVDGDLITTTAPTMESVVLPSFTCEVNRNSVLRYCYGLFELFTVVNCRKDDLSNFQGFEMRVIAREVTIQAEADIVHIHDVIDEPLYRQDILRDCMRVFVSLEKWMINRSLHITGVSLDASTSRVVSVHDDCVTCDLLDSQLCDIRLEICSNNDSYSVVITEDDLRKINTKPSIDHGDGKIVSKASNGSIIELHAVIISSIASATTAMLSHQILRGAARFYRPSHSPLLIGHRGSGMNSSKGEKEVENSIPSFNAAHASGLTTVEFDLQISHDNDVIVFHDYVIPLPNSVKMLPIASSATRLLKTIPLPAPALYQGPDLYMPTISEMFCYLHADIHFNIEVKYPTVYELEMAELGITKNAYVDRIIDVVEETHSGRTIYYSSFDPDVCFMLLHKQARYPVFLLLDDDSVSSAVSKEQWMAGRWKEYTTFLTDNGAFRGVVACTTLLDKEAVDWLHSKKLIVYCWGSDNNRKEKRMFLTEIGVDGIIADNFNE